MIPPETRKEGEPTLTTRVSIPLEKKQRQKSTVACTAYSNSKQTKQQTRKTRRSSRQFSPCPISKTRRDKKRASVESRILCPFFLFFFSFPAMYNHSFFSSFLCVHVYPKQKTTTTRRKPLRSTEREAPLQSQSSSSLIPVMDDGEEGERKIVV